MTPQEKADLLVYKYFDVVNINFATAVHCALIAVAELKNQSNIFKKRYWNKVEKELYKL